MSTAPLVILPKWLQDLRKSEIGNPVLSSTGTSGDYIMGLHMDEIFNDVIGGGQADFDAPYKHLTGADRALLYAYLNQRGHLEELCEAFKQLFSDTKPIDPFIVLDVGCGPFTGGLALATMLGSTSFSYIGCDRSSAMRELGEKLALAAETRGALRCLDRFWVKDLDSIKWLEKPGWRPVLIIASYLFASSTLDIESLVGGIDGQCARFGRGPATVLYTNSCRAEANQNFPKFRRALEQSGFTLVAEDQGLITIDRIGGFRERKLRYALFHRQARLTLHLQGSCPETT